MQSFAYMVGSVVAGKLRPTNSFGSKFDTDNVLGTAFVVDVRTGTCLTCSHVLTDDDITSDKEFAFATLDENHNFSLHLVIKSSLRRHPTVDVMMFQVENAGSLKAWTVGTSELSLASDVTVLGFAKDHLASNIGNNKVIPRALKSYVVSEYATECEIDKPLITTMSGSPVLSGDKVLGIAAANRQYAIDQYLVESVVHQVDGVAVNKEVYEYKETSRFGVFVKASSWSSWLAEAIT